ncbi:ABC transporter substrate-binding protein [Sorangium sp. So ce233]|uniref:ABC transporter substrate-binding protein n=1 Tax=Sorangium sp. So ce233 TaxID=3133290 RepID=UPI003F5E8ADF
MRDVQAGLLVGLASMLSASCSPTAPDHPEEAAPDHPENAVVLGSLLPLSGSESAIGRNLDQAMSLAVEHVNAAGGIDGRPLAIVGRDSHSGSERGLEQLLELLYTDHIAYLVGPEDNELAREIAPDVEALDVFHMMPGHAAPSVARSEGRGGWMRLAPSPSAVGCALAKIAVREGIETVNSLAERKDYHASVSSEFTTSFAALGGRLVPSVTFMSGEPTYTSRIEAALASDPGRTLLATDPATAATIVTEWTDSGSPGTWLLGPALRADALLAKIPAGSLDGYLGVSPSLSLRSECQPVDEAQETVDCTTGNAAAFAEQFSRRWSGEAPLPTAHFYYDGVILIAMGLVYAQATSGTIPASGQELHAILRELSSPDHEAASWRDLNTAMTKLRAGIPLRYVGAAAEYEFDSYGASQHHFMQEWTIDGDAFVDLAPVAVTCEAWQ